MPALRCFVAWSVCVAAFGGCFGGFEQQAPPSVKPAPPRSDAAPSPTGGVRAAKPEQQSYAAAWRLICEAEQRAGVAATLDRSARGAAVAEWIVRQLTNRDARYWFIAFGKVKEDRKAYFLTEARRAGQARCALAELLFAEPADPAPTSAPIP